MFSIPGSQNRRTAKPYSALGTDKYVDFYISWYVNKADMLIETTCVTVEDCLTSTAPIGVKCFFLVIICKILPKFFTRSQIEIFFDMIT